MKSSRGFSNVFGILGGLMALLTVVVSLSNLHADPVLVRRSKGAEACARQMLDAICAGDYDQAGSFFYGSPKLQSGAETQSESGKLIWDAFIGSLGYELVGDSYVSSQGVSQKLVLHRLDLDSVTEKLADRSRALLAKRVEEAVDVAEIYDGASGYREDFVMGVLRDATMDALREDSRYVDQEVVLNLIFDQDRWWILADQSLMNAISGGVV